MPGTASNDDDGTTSDQASLDNDDDADVYLLRRDFLLLLKPLPWTTSRISIGRSRAFQNFDHLYSK